MQRCFSPVRSVPSWPLLQRFYATSEKDHVSFFRSILGETDVITDPDTLAPFNQDWLKQYQGNSSILLQPRSAAALSNVLAYCNENSISVVPQGGNTGLVGGSIPTNDEVILSLLKMRSIRTFDESSGIVSCDAGITLQELNEFANQKGFLVPLDLGAKGSCTIGGNVATNAGGIRFLRYGTLHGSVSGLEVVLPNGEVIDTLNSLRKDNTGYDVKQLFIGSEGTLGVITGVSIQCVPSPKEVSVALLNCESFEHVLKTFRAAKSELGEILSAFELIDKESYDVSVNHGSTDCMESSSPFYVLIETSSASEAAASMFNDFLEKVLEEETVVNGTIAADSTQFEEIWRLRESISEALTKEGYVYKYDLSLPYSHYYKIVDVVREKVPSALATVYAFGHVGDGNVHLNVVSPKFNPEVKEMLDPLIYEYCKENGGSVSAEHGVGQLKKDYLHYGKSNGHVALLKNIKNLFDPNNILNPNKMFPQ